MCECGGLDAVDPVGVIYLWNGGTTKILPLSSQERGPEGEVN